MGLGRPAIFQGTKYPWVSPTRIFPAWMLAICPACPKVYSRIQTWGPDIHMMSCRTSSKRCLSCCPSTPGGRFRTKICKCNQAIAHNSCMQWTYRTDKDHPLSWYKCDEIDFELAIKSRLANWNHAAMRARLVNHSCPFEASTADPTVWGPSNWSCSQLALRDAGRLKPLSTLITH